jgi:hypothetical protein
MMELKKSLRSRVVICGQPTETEGIVHLTSENTK